MDTMWIHKEDCDIIRDDSEYDICVKDHAVLIDTTDGSRVFVVPDSFTDEQIWECLRIANTAFNYGHVQGVQSKIRDIRQTLGLDSA